MKRWASILALAVIMLVTGCGGRPAALIVHLGYEADGNRTREVVVRDAGGKELRRIEVGGRPVSLFPLAGGYRLVVGDLDGRTYVVDAGTGSIAEIKAPGEDPGLVRIEQGLVLGGGKTWAIVAENESGVDYLLELASGTLHDLKTLAPDSDLEWAQFSADEDYLLVTDFSSSWVLPTADPGRARRLGEDGRRSFPASLLGDGKRVLYVAENQEGRKELRLESLDGTGMRVLVTDDNLVGGLPVPGRDEVLVEYKQSLAVISLRSGEEQTLLDFPGPSAVTPHFGPGNSALLWVLENMQDDRWYYLDLKGRTVRPLPGLDGRRYAAPGGTLLQSALLIVSDAAQAQNQPGSAHLAAVDVATGEIQTDLGVSNLRQWWLASASDGLDYLLVQLHTADQYELWLFRAGAGEAEKVAEGGFVTGAVSPDRRWIAVSEKPQDSLQAEVKLIEIEHRNTVDVGPGQGPIWVLP